MALGGRPVLRSWDPWLRARGRSHGGIRYCGTETKEGREVEGVKPLLIHIDLFAPARSPRDLRL
jgi:hypothetical protein